MHFLKLGIVSDNCAEQNIQEFVSFSLHQQNKTPKGKQDFKKLNLKWMKHCAYKWIVVDLEHSMMLMSRWYWQPHGDV